MTAESGRNAKALRWVSTSNLEKKKETSRKFVGVVGLAAFVPEIRFGRPLKVSRSAAVGTDEVSRKESASARAIDVICHHVFRSPTGCVWASDDFSAQIRISRHCAALPLVILLPSARSTAESHSQHRLINFFIVHRDRHVLFSLESRHHSAPDVPEGRWVIASVISEWPRPSESSRAAGRKAEKRVNCEICPAKMASSLTLPRCVCADG